MAGECTAFVQARSVHASSQPSDLTAISKPSHCNLPAIWSHCKPPVIPRGAGGRGGGVGGAGGGAWGRAYCVPMRSQISSSVPSLAGSCESAYAKREGRSRRPAEAYPPPGRGWRPPRARSPPGRIKAGGGTGRGLQAATCRMGRPPTPMALNLASSLNPSLWAAAFDVRSRVTDHVAVGGRARVGLVARIAPASWSACWGVSGVGLG